MLVLCFFFQAEDGIRDWSVTGVQTCALPIYIVHDVFELGKVEDIVNDMVVQNTPVITRLMGREEAIESGARALFEIGRASCRERVWVSVGVGAFKKEE